MFQEAISSNACYSQLFDDLLLEFNAYHQRAILRAKDQNIPAWLTSLPLARNQFDLSAQEFRDALALRYKKTLTWMPRCCDGCGGEFSIEYAFDVV